MEKNLTSFKFLQIFHLRLDQNHRIIGNFKLLNVEIQIFPDNSVRCFEGKNEFRMLLWVFQIWTF